MFQHLRGRIAASVSTVTLLLILGWSNAWADTVDALLLLLPDPPGTGSSGVGCPSVSPNPTDPRTTVWLDAAAEEGIHVVPIFDCQFLALDSSKYVGIILPDQVHTTASLGLVTAVTDYVSRGGKLMLVYDAGVLMPDGTYPITGPSRFSSLAGTEYANYNNCYPSCDSSFVALVNATAPQSTLRKLRVPPGKSVTWPSSPSGATDPLQGVTSYFYGYLKYPSYVTNTSYTGTYLLSASNTTMPMAGINNYGSSGGRVLFVNTPLGYLKGYGTDGLLLHGFLRYFAVDLLRLPYLSALPKGKGGLVVNVHVDCAEALNPMQTLKSAGVWDKGTYSIHFTAGPDCINFGDALGLNVPANSLTQSWITYFVSKNHQLGSHGGWIHDYYGINVSETNQSDPIVPPPPPLLLGSVPPNCPTPQTFREFVICNWDAIKAVSGKPVLEYSAPEGNTPKWSVQWMQDNGMVGYYWVGNTGMAPTRSYREGQLFTKKIWSFPITPYGSAATFEEFEASNIPKAEAASWLTSLVDFAVQRRTSRLMYFHPPGAEDYLSAVNALLNRGNQYGSRFAWYTMNDLATFLSRRELASWQVTRLTTGVLQFDVTHPSNLNGLTWVLSKSDYSQPVAVGGVTVTSDTAAAEWIVTGNAGAKSARFNTTRLTTF